MRSYHCKAHRVAVGALLGALAAGFWAALVSRCIHNKDFSKPSGTAQLCDDNVLTAPRRASALTEFLEDSAICRYFYVKDSLSRIPNLNKFEYENYIAYKQQQQLKKRSEREGHRVTQM
jgi:hypothetical protein